MRYFDPSDGFLFLLLTNEHGSVRNRRTSQQKYSSGRRKSAARTHGHAPPLFLRAGASDMYRVSWRLYRFACDCAARTIMIHFVTFFSIRTSPIWNFICTLTVCRSERPAAIDSCCSYEFSMIGSPASNHFVSKSWRTIENLISLSGGIPCRRLAMICFEHAHIYEIYYNAGPRELDCLRVCRVGPSAAVDTFSSVKPWTVVRLHFLLVIFY